MQTLQAPLREGDADDWNLEIASFHHRIECREDHLMGEVSGDTEEQQRVRTGGGHQEPAFLAVVFFPELTPGYQMRLQLHTKRMAVKAPQRGLLIADEADHGNITQL
jgi:hypothetical protein